MSAASAPDNLTFCPDDARDGGESPDPGPSARALIVGGSPERPPAELLRELRARCGYTVACDAGADACLLAGVPVDVFLGDDDSVSPEGLVFARSTMRLEETYPVDKDDVDTGLAVSWVRAHRPDTSEIVLTGVSGGRTDHALAVLGIAARAADLRPTIEEGRSVTRILSPAGRRVWRFSPADAGRTVSVVSLSPRAVVSEAGMRWNLDHAGLELLSDLGVSNVVESPAASVEVHEGVVFVSMLRAREIKSVTRV